MIDGLRGIAASLVMLHHFSGHRAFAPVAAVLPAGANDALGYGGVGVAVFFVLSGFVIAHSLGTERMTWGYFGNFALRRSIRLDPPYWAAIALVVLMELVKQVALSDYRADLPSAPSLAAHATYTFGFFGFEPILAVFWTLCHEVQFYLFYCLLLAGFRRSDNLWPALPFAATGVASAFSPDLIPGLASGTWWMFALGVLIYFCHVSPATRRVLIGYVIAVALSVAVKPSPYGVVAVGTGLLIWLAVHLGKADAWLTWRPVLYLGTVSYSLYLVHGILGWQTLSLGADKFGSATAAAGLGWLVLAIGVSVAAAHVLHLVVERPSLRLAKVVKRWRAASPAGAPEAASALNGA